MARAFLLLEAMLEEAELENRVNQIHTVRLRRSLRDQAKALDLSDAEFQAHYRLSKGLFVNLCSELRPYIPQGKRSTKVSVECKVSIIVPLHSALFCSYLGESDEIFVSRCLLDYKHVLLQVLAALSFFATGSYQKPLGMSYLHGLSQASVSNAVREVTMALNNHQILKKYICFPQTQQERQTVVNG